MFSLMNTLHAFLYFDLPFYFPTFSVLWLSSHRFPRKMSAKGSCLTVQCNVCETAIDYALNYDQHIVQCPTCKETTPIRPAPEGRKYARCPCNCLLISSESSTRIACPRADCRRVLTLNDAAMTRSEVRVPEGAFRVQCAHYEKVFVHNTQTNSLSTCPHCKKISSVGRTSFFGYTSAAVVVLIFSLLFSSHLPTATSPWFYVTAAALLGFYLGYKAVDLWQVEVSTIVQRMGSTELIVIAQSKSPNNSEIVQEK